MKDVVGCIHGNARPKIKDKNSVLGANYGHHRQMSLGQNGCLRHHQRSIAAEHDVTVSGHIPHIDHNLTNDLVTLDTVASR